MEKYKIFRVGKVNKISTCEQTNERFRVITEHTGLFIIENLQRENDSRR